MITTEEHKAIATEILRQLGGNKFKVMTGAYQPLALDNTPHGGLQIRFKGSRKANCLRVIVDAMDTYTVEFWRLPRKIPKKQPKPVKVYEGVYNDMLQDIFKDVTGLETSLGTLGR